MVSRKGKNPSGQAQIVSAVLVFSLGLVMLMGFTYAFSSLKAKIVADFQSKTAGEILEYVAIKAIMLDELNATYASATFTIPAKIGEVDYTISTGDDGSTLMLLMPGFSTSIPTPVRFSGRLDSNNGKAMLTYKDNEITMRGVFN